MPRGWRSPAATIASKRSLRRAATVSRRKARRGRHLAGGERGDQLLAGSKTASCGKVVARSANWHPQGASFGLGGYWVRFPEDKRPDHGDSGGPVWNKLTGRAVGLISASRPSEEESETLVAPLLHPPNMDEEYVPGILNHFGIRPMQLKINGG